MAASHYTEDDEWDDELHYPPGFGSEDFVSHGNTGMIYLDRASNTVVKVPFDGKLKDFVARMDREQQVYERLEEYGGHPGLLSYKGTFADGIRLQFAPNYALRTYNQKYSVGYAQKLRWAVQIAQALGFIHKAGVIHGDLTCANIFLDEELHAKVADFAGSSIDGSELLVLITENHELPGGPLLSIRADLFAFGSVLYEIMTGQGPYRELKDREIEARFSAGEFPDTDSLGAVGAVIRKCWHAEYSDAEAIVDDLRAEENKALSPRSHGSYIELSILALAVIFTTASLWFGRRSLARSF